MATSWLGEATGKQSQSLCATLFAWPVCEKHQNGGVCSNGDCAWKRYLRLGPFLGYYKRLTAIYDPELRNGERAALQSHEDLRQLIDRLRSFPQTRRSELSELLFPQAPNQPLLNSHDCEKAINLGVRILFTINCSYQRQNRYLLEDGFFHKCWRNDACLAEFFSDTFPLTDHPDLNDMGNGRSLFLKSGLTAGKMRKRLKIRFEPTDDIRSHLLLNRKAKTVEIYHQTSLLKEHLRLTEKNAPGLELAESLKLGALPRAIALEILDSIQCIVFPVSDQSSRSYISSLVAKSGFDPDCQRCDLAAFQRSGDEPITYHYFGTRLMDLMEEMENPSPHGYEKWLERKSRGRHVMLATVAGILLAVLLGIAALAVSIYSADVQYKAWKHPVAPNQLAVHREA